MSARWRMRLASALVRVLLWLYPRSFRSEVGPQMVRDVRRRAGELGNGGAGAAVTTLWLVRLSASLVVNAIGVRRDLRTGRRPSAMLGGGISWLDFKLGVRMLVRFPGLTLVAGLAIAFAIGLGTGTYQFLSDWYDPTMPFEDGDRIVELWSNDREIGRQDPRVLHDFVDWREQMTSVVEIGAFRTFQRNLFTERGGSTPLIGAEISTVAFDIARTPPVLGRPLLPADEAPGAPEVVVLSHEVWERYLGADPEAVGRTVRLGSEVATVVGVMPPGFGWPRGYRLWTALKVDPLAHPRGEGPALQVVGKLAPGVSLAEARAELATVGARLAAEYPASNGRREPRAETYGGTEVGVGDLMIAMFKSLSSLGFLGLIVLVCMNVALLLFARTAARQSEIVVRGALGASRGRIVGQLFAEALVLGVAAGAVGVLVARVGYEWTLGLFHELAPGFVGYWIDGSLEPTVVAYALLFTLIAATLSGVLPALKATGKGLNTRLQRVGTGGVGLEFGRLWSTIIVGQIAVTVAFVPIIGLVGHGIWEMSARPFGMPAHEYLTAELTRAQTTSTLWDLGPSIQRAGYTPEFAAAHAEVKRRLRLESGVSSVTVAEQVPGAPHHPARVLVEGPTAALTVARGHYTKTAAVDMDFFRVMNARILAGRGFTESDADSDERVAIVDDVFVRRILEDRNALGRRFRFNDVYASVEREADARDIEIVGVVSRVSERDGPFGDATPTLYLPLGATETYPVRLALRVGPDPTAFAGRLREIVADVDPELLLTGVRSLEDADWATRRSFEMWFWVLLGLGGVGITLATAGLYSILSFTVSKRTREIGVRVALGADRFRVVWPVLKRTWKQIGIGAAIGAAVFWGVLMGSELRFRPEAEQVVAYAAYLLGMMVVCALAAVVPVRRALAIEPTEALRGEG